MPFFLRSVYYLRAILKSSPSLFVRLCVPRVVFFGFAQWNISIVVLHISLPLCRGGSDNLFQKTLCLMNSCPHDLVFFSSHQPAVWFRLWFINCTIFLKPVLGQKVFQKCRWIYKLLSCECQLPRLRDEILRVKNDIRPILFQVLPNKRHAPVRSSVDEGGKSSKESLCSIMEKELRNK